MAKDSNIQNELKDISQAVANLDGKTPFAIPAGYFQQFPQKLMQNFENESFIKEEFSLSPLMRSLQSKTPFEVPASYFNEFNAAIPRTSPATIKLGSRRWTSYAAAACIGGLIFGLIYLSNQQSKQPTFASNSISNETMASYLIENELMDDSYKELEGSTADEYAMLDVSASTISDMLKDIPDTDITGFLDQNSFEESKSFN
ncbi:MAG: hypothetical protein ACO22R_00585 [Chitinophagaceae bacterium]|jgi:hypothetical protein